MKVYVVAVNNVVLVQLAKCSADYRCRPMQDIYRQVTISVRRSGNHLIHVKI